MGLVNVHILADLEQRWSCRNIAFKHTSVDYQKTQHRLLWLLAVPPEERFETFLRWSEGLKFSTRAAYWTALMAALLAVGGSPTTADLKNRAWLDMKTAQEVPQTARPLSPAEAWTLWRENPDHVSLGILVCFVLGQRLSDISLLRLERITYHGNILAVTLIEGKVIRSIGPYSLYLDSRQPVGMLLRDFVTRRASAYLKDAYLFYSPQSFLATASLRLRAIGCENRSVRRGGLQTMANAGIPVEGLLSFSKHQSVPMLMRYLGYRSLDDANCMLRMTERAFFPWAPPCPQSF